MEFVILFGLFALLLVIGVPVAFSLLAATLATVLYLAVPPIVVFQQMGSDITSVALLAIPLFIFTGELMMKGGLSDSDFEDDELGDELALRDQPAPPAAPASPRSPVVKEFVGASANTPVNTPVNTPRPRRIHTLPFRAQICFGGKYRHLDSYRLVDAAARAHDAVARLIAGRKLNFSSSAARCGAGAASGRASAQRKKCAKPPGPGIGSDKQPTKGDPVAKRAKPGPMDAFLVRRS
jgi:hypothetical protein